MPQFDAQTDSLIESWTEALDNETICPTCKAPRGFIPLQAYAKQQFDDAWERLYALFDRGMGTPGLAARYITRHGWTFSREVSEPEERLDASMLQEILSPVLWEAISVPTGQRELSQPLLARAMTAGFISAEQVKAATILPKPVASRHRRKTTKNDAAILAAIGIPAAADSAEKAG